jgi:hypothetical protein
MHGATRRESCGAHAPNRTVYRLHEATGAERTNLTLADGQSGLATPPPMQHVTRSRCAAETLQARDAQVTNRIPFEMIIAAA